MYEIAQIGEISSTGAESGLVDIRPPVGFGHLLDVLAIKLLNSHGSPRGRSAGIVDGYYQVCGDTIEKIIGRVVAR